ncbi:TniQ protein [Methylobacterium sp. UNC300MFChir4.1]|uniref:TniQ family protein n=1 Tax=Methylobacterium sp. UNC300MFChir4.1 TaxID=1502747 RepID=UPI0008ABC142|nr:TniQ family protein [Methylobacterium sp. UNC300MFChir4.1]SEO46581.1 TniQ protein [Methylobacterium sp. UNC300MFChir4.1]
MTRLRPLLPLHPDEALTSYVSRLAALHRIKTANDFGRELRFSFRRLCYGDADALARLSDLTNLPIDTLEQAAPASTEDGWFIRGEGFKRTSLRRSAIGYCPACLRRDIGSDPDPKVKAYDRLVWELAAFRTCPEHAIALTIVPAPTDFYLLRDFIRRIDCSIPALDRALANAVPRQATVLERYIHERMEFGRGRHPVFGEMPLEAVIRACEVFGSADVFGPARKFNTLSPEEATIAGGVGFEALDRGQTGITDLLDRVRTTCLGNSQAIGKPAVVYSQLYKWLYRASQPEFARIKNHVVDHIVRHPTSDLASTVFGKPIEGRPWHSLRTAHLALGIGAKRLRSALVASGRISKDTLTLADHQVIVPVDDIINVVEEFRECINYTDLGPYLGLNRETIENFIGPGLIEPIVPLVEHLKYNVLFRREDVKRFLDRLFQDARPVDARTPAMCTILQASRRARCRVRMIIDLILERRLKWTGRLKGVEGIAALLVDVQDVRAAIHPELINGLTFHKTVGRMRIKPKLLNALIASGYIDAKIFGNESRREPHRVISIASVERFEQTYMTRHRLTRTLKMKYDAVDRLCLEFGLSHIFVDAEQNIKIYRLDEALAFIESVKRDR